MLHPLQLPLFAWEFGDVIVLFASAAVQGAIFGGAAIARPTAAVPHGAGAADMGVGMR
jgi:hypothetical protein